MTLWFTADQHFGYGMVAEYRGFKNAHKHDQALFEAYNDVVGEHDEVYIVGDLCMWGPQNVGNVERIIRKLKGKKYLILGNHDKLNPFAYVEMGIISVHTALETQWLMTHYVDSSEIWKPILVHDPSTAATNVNRHWICGHVHSLFTTCGRVANVGVDVRNLAPVHIRTIYNEINRASTTPEQSNMKDLVKNRHRRQKNESEDQG